MFVYILKLIAGRASVIVVSSSAIGEQETGPTRQHPSDKSDASTTASFSLDALGSEGSLIPHLYLHPNLHLDGLSSAGSQ